MIIYIHNIGDYHYAFSGNPVPDQSAIHGTFCAGHRVVEVENVWRPAAGIRQLIETGLGLTKYRTFIRGFAGSLGRKLWGGRFD